MKKLLAVLMSMLLLVMMIPMGAVSVSAELPTDAGWVWPVDGGLFGRGFENGHSGIDIVAGGGTAVKSVNIGTVLCASKATTSAEGYCGTCGRKGAGYHVTIVHPNGLIGMYAHLSDVCVYSGQEVVAGQQVGNVGSTGNSTGDHLHFSFFANNYIADANLVDPLYYLTPFNNVYVSGITETSATIYADFGAAGPTIVNAGIYIGTDPANMIKITEVLNTEGYYPNGDAIPGLFYNTLKWWKPLEKDTTYYYQVWISRFGKEYSSSIKTFRTGGHTHSWSAWSVTKAATCAVEGQQKRTCACGGVETKTIPATGIHTYDNACDTTCNVCGAVRTVGSHSYSSKITTAATCGSAGVKTYTCSICGDNYTESIPATGNHTYDDEYDATCNVCDEEREVPEKPPVTPDLPADAPAFVVESTDAREGEEFTVAIRTQRNSGIVSMKLSVAYDADVLELIALEEQNFANVVFSPLSKNPFMVNWADAISPNNTTDGVVVLATFRVKEGVPLGKTEITLTYDPEDVYDENYDNVAFRVENGSVEIVDYIPGDVNADGRVNNKDLGLLQQYLSGWDVRVDEKAGDVNADGRVNNKDLGLFQQYLSGWDVELG